MPPFDYQATYVNLYVRRWVMSMSRPPDTSVCLLLLFYFSIKIYVKGTQKNRLSDIQNLYINLWIIFF